MTNKVHLRTLTPDDNAGLAKIIRSSLEEFGANKEGTVYYDESTDDLYQLFQKEGSIYYVAELEGQLLGGGGIFPSEGLPTDTCELVKMYLTPAARGKGIGAMIINTCLSFAKAQGFSKVYIETMPELKKAMGVYEKFGFSYINGPIGNTGHFGCEIWMLKTL